VAALWPVRPALIGHEANHRCHYEERSDEATSIRLRSARRATVL